MPTFPTPDPISVSIDLIGDVRITASDRDDTVVAVRPANRSKPGDQRAAEDTTVEFADGRLTIAIPKSWRRYTPFGGHESIEVSIELPTGSQVVSESDLGNVAAEGELGSCQLKTAMGNIRLDHTGAVRATTSFGNITVERVDGLADLKTGSGEVRVEQIDGDALIKNSNGDTTVGTVSGELRVKASNGDIAIGRVGASTVAKSANGDIRIATVERGTIVMETAAGELDLGIRDGTAAWLDAVTRCGAVRSQLGSTEPPAPSSPTVEVRARTSVGDIVIRRVPADHPGSPTSGLTNDGSTTP